MLKKINEAVAFLGGKTRTTPRVGMILGSGLGSVADQIDIEVALPFGEIPHAPISSVVGHTGRFLIGRVAGVPVAVMQGRVHYYEGYSMDEVLFLPRVLARLGLKRAIVTNAAGGVNANFHAGDLMLISDHVNLFGVNPLRGANIDEFGVRFPDMTEAYSAELRKKAQVIAASHGVSLKEGVYFGLSGPTYETPAEIRMYRTLGADAVGMSTVPEVTALAHMGVEVLGMSCITNLAAGVSPEKLTHAEVIETTQRIQPIFSRLILELVPALAD